MGKSRRKPYYSIVCGGDNIKEWRSEANRKLRRRTKQMLYNCKDYDNLVLPILREVSDVWSSPRDGNLHYYHKPLMNQCEWDYVKYVHRWGNRSYWSATYRDYDGEHFPDCRCYSNKQNFYWKIKRK